MVDNVNIDGAIMLGDLKVGRIVKLHIVQHILGPSHSTIFHSSSSFHCSSPVNGYTQVHCGI